MVTKNRKFTWLIAGRLNVVVLFFIISVQSFAQQKNVLIIAVDDLKPAIGAFGDKMALTPNMDKLANSGVTFVNAYTQQAVCGPSRASLLTGLRPDRTEVWNLKTFIRDRNPDVVTLPQHFKQNGYQTHGIGKVFDPRSVDKGHDKVSWSIPYVNPTNLPGPNPAPYMGSYQSVEHVAQINFYEKLADSKGLQKGKKQNFVRKNYKPSTESAPVADDAYVDGRIANSAMEKLDKFSKSDDPFMLFVGFKKPHLPFVAPTKYWNLYDRKKIALAEWQKRAKGSTKLAYHGLGELGSYTDIPEAVNESTGLISDEKQLELIHGYYASVSYIDAQIGKVLARLKKNGQLENTIIVLWGDHGYHLGDHNLWCKHTNFEQATRTPLIIVSPGGKSGVVEKTPVELLDIFPTLCELTGVKAGNQIQGTSLASVLTGKKPIKKYAISQWPSRKNDGMGYSIRTEKYRYTEWYDTYKSTIKRDPKYLLATELYDYENDYLETKNLVKDKNHVTTLKEHQQLLHTFLDSQVLRDKFGQEEIAKPRGESIRSLVDKNFKGGTVYVGATIESHSIGTIKSELLAKQFSYTTPENAAKQSAVHPRPGVWKWDRIDRIVNYATKNDITVRLHGPISPQASRWAKEDTRTSIELLKNMTEYMTEQCKHFNGNPTIKWMDVVNETVNRDGTWFGPKPGVEEWENPWLAMGVDNNNVPLYITKSFELANKYAPDIKQVYNQHGSMEAVMWEKVKETILYLRKKGYRIDGLGWQAHIKNTEELAHDLKALAYLAELIDWAHANKLEFHVTEIDYKTESVFDDKAKERQASAYANILKVLLSKRSTGVVTYNTWGLSDGVGKHKDTYQFIFDEQLRAKPAFYAIQKVLENPDDLALVLDGKPLNLIRNSGFENKKLEWTLFGSSKVVEKNQKHGQASIELSANKSGIRQTIKNLKPNSDYELTAWVKTETGERVVIKAKPKGEEAVVAGTGSKQYKLLTLTFKTGAEPEAVIIFQKWGKAEGSTSKSWADDIKLYEL